MLIERKHTQSLFSTVFKEQQTVADHLYGKVTSENVPSTSPESAHIFTTIDHDLTQTLTGFDGAVDGTITFEDDQLVAVPMAMDGTEIGDEEEPDCITMATDDVVTETYKDTTSSVQDKSNEDKSVNKSVGNFNIKLISRSDGTEVEFQRDSKGQIVVPQVIEKPEANGDTQTNIPGNTKSLIKQKKIVYVIQQNKNCAPPTDTDIINAIKKRRTESNADTQVGTAGTQVIQADTQRGNMDTQGPEPQTSSTQTNSSATPVQLYANRFVKISCLDMCIDEVHLFVSLFICH